MELPNVINELRDPSSGVTYRVKAYRKLTREELILAVRHYHASRKGKKPRRGDTVTIVSIIGHND